MTQQIVFNGASLIRPTGATKVDTSRFDVPTVTGTGKVAIVGTASGGEPRVVKCFRKFEQVRDFFRSGDIVDAARILTKPSADSRMPGGAFEIFCYKTNNSTQSTYTMQRFAGPSAGQSQALLSGPYTVTPGATLNYETDNSSGAQDITFSGTAATVAGAAPSLPPTNGHVLALLINALDEQFIVFDGTETTAQLVADRVNGKVQGMYAVVNGSNIDFISTQFGTGSKVQITSNSTAALLTAIGHSVGSTSGTGVGADLSNLTEAELKTLVDASTHMVLDTTTTPPTWKSANTGASAFLTFNSTVPAGLLGVLGLTAATYNGSDSGTPVNIIDLKSRDYGAHTNSISFTLTDPASPSQQRRITISDKSSGLEVLQTSPILGNFSKLTVQYTGAGSAAAMTVTSTAITTTITGGPGGEDLNLPFTTYETLDDIVNAINASSVYTATADITGATLFKATNLDWVTSVDIKTAAKPFYSAVYDLVTWINNNADAVTATRLSTGDQVPNEYASSTYLTGGTLGSDVTTDWTTGALDALSDVHVDHIVPLLSADEGSVVFADVAAAFSTHAADLSATKGKSERTCWMAASGNAAAQKTLSQSINAEHTVQCGGVKLTLPSGLSGDLAELDEWAYACTLAGMRAGAEIGEPLTHKIIRQYGVTRSYTDDDIEDMILAGVTCLAQNKENNTWRTDKCITTYTASDNNALTEESLVNIWKTISKDLRTGLEDRFIGGKGIVSRINDIKGFADEKLQLYGPKDRGGNDSLTDGVDENGNPVLAHQNLVVEIGANGNPSDVVELSVELNLVSGINFLLKRMYTLPARISTEV